MAENAKNPAPDPHRDEERPDASIDETIQTNDDEFGPTGQTTIVPDQMATVVPDDHATIIPDEKPVDANAVTSQDIEHADVEDDDVEDDDEDSNATDVTESTTPISGGKSALTKKIDDDELTVLELDQTVVELDQTVVELEQTVVEDATDKTAEDMGRTVANIDQTVEMESGQNSIANATTDQRLPSSKTNVYAGKSKSDKTVSNLAGKTKSNLAGSIMESAEIGQTINPRELSDKERSLWNSAVGDGRQGDTPSALSPAIQRTFSDRQFDRLRTCKVAEKADDPNVPLDFKLVRKLGQGGMGDVYLAHQASLDRRLALKLIRPIEGRKRAQLSQTGKLEEFEETRRQQFLSEAIVTSDLDHPNIVPIHEAGFSSDGDLFYAMKCVVGDPWSDKIKEYTREQNLEVLMKVCDAIACAHNRGVIHRDIKPQNIMLGGFGVVLVMDWGLALPTPKYEKSDSILATSGLGGTPAFMAPEMAIGPLEKIGAASDIYLLGATLYLIVTGHAPHQAKNVTECMLAVRNNTIRPVPPEQQGELLDIALKAMASEPKDRFASVDDFQQAIRDYRSHAESIALATRAFEELRLAKSNQSYSDFSRATFGFEESIKSWGGNEKAHHGLAEATLLHAETACKKGDYELGLSLLDENNSEHVATIAKLRKGLKEGEQRIVRLARLRKAAAAMLAFIFIGGGVASGWIYLENQQTKEALRIAEEQRALARTNEAEAKRQEGIAIEQAALATKNETEAKKQEGIAIEQAALAIENEIEAKKQEGIAIEQAALAKKNEIEAEEQKELANEQTALKEIEKEEAKRQEKKAHYEEYVAKIGLAKVQLENNEAKNARAILSELEDTPHANSWEWRWLFQQANQSSSESNAEAPVTDASFSPSGREGVIALNSGQVQRLTLDGDGSIDSPTVLVDPILKNRFATTVAYSPGRDEIAVGTRSGEIVLISAGGASRLLDHSHTRRVSDLQFTKDGLLVSGSDDRTVRVWNPETNQELTASEACWHLSPVRRLAVAGSASDLTIAVAVADESTGSVVIWKVDSSRAFSLRQVGEFSGHEGPIVSVALNSDALLAASGDLDGNVLMWNPDATKPVDYTKSLATALAALEGKADNSRNQDRQDTTLRVARLVDTSDETQQRFISTRQSQRRNTLAHDDVVKSIRFSDDGKSIVTGSDDNTIKLWDVNSRRLQQTLRGHGGWVVDAEFLQGKPDQIISASNDSTVRTWKPRTYLGALVSQNLADVAGKPAARETLAHENEIASARFSHDGTKVVTASGDRTARVMAIDKETLAFREVVRLDDELLEEGTPFVAMSMHVDPRHQRLFIGSADATIRIWDLQRGVEIGSASQTGLNSSFAVSADGTLMLTGSSSPNVKAMLWRVDTSGQTQPRVIQRLAMHDEAITAFAISPNSELLFTGDRGGYGILWDAATGKLVGDPVETVRGFRINAAEFSPNSHELYLAADDEQLTRIDVRSRKLLGRMNHDGFVTKLSLSANGRFALTVSELLTQDRLQTVATLWDLTTLKGHALDEIRQPLNPDTPLTSRDRRRITSADFDEKSSVALVSRAAAEKRGSIVSVFELSSVIARTATLTSLRGIGPSETVSYELPIQLGTSEVGVPLDASSMVTMNENGAFRWNLATQQLITSFRSHAQLTEASFSCDDAFVATASRSVKIWDAETGDALAKIEAPHSGPVRTVAMAPTASGATSYLFATGGDDGKAKIWSFDSKTNAIKPIVTLSREGHSPAIRRVCFSPTSDRLFAVGQDGSATIFKVDGLQTLVLDAKDAGDLVCAAFSRDGKCVAAGGTNNTVRVWSLVGERGSVLLEGHADVVNDVALQGTLDADLRVISASAKDAKLWDPRFDASGNPASDEGREIFSLRGHKGDVTSVDVSPDGRLLMTASRDGTVVLWPAAPRQATTPKPEKPEPENIFEDLIK